MCEVCCENGTQAQCLACRNLQGEEFPFTAESEFNALWDHLILAFQREVPMCILATLVLMALSYGAGLVGQVLSGVVFAALGIKFDLADGLKNPTSLGAAFFVWQLIGGIIGMVGNGIGLIGFYRVLFDVLMGKKADIGRMFSQLHLLPQYALLETIKLLMMLVGAGVVMALLYSVGFFPFDGRGVPGLVMGISVVLLGVSVLFLPAWLFSTPELMVGKCNALEAFRRAWVLGRGQRVRTLGYSVLALLIMFGGVLACIVGLLAAVPVSTMLVLALFMALRRSASFSPADFR